MKNLLSLRSRSRPEPSREAQIVGLDEQDAGDIFNALSSETTRDILTRLYDEPGTASEISEQIDSSLQNTKYHLDKLRGASLVEVADTWYSEQGNEMKVYAPTSKSIVLLAGSDNTKSTLREALNRFIGVFGVLVVGSVIVEKIIRTQAVNPYQVDRPSILPSWIPSIEMGVFISPGFLFFTGGLIVLSVIMIWAILDHRT